MRKSIVPLLVGGLIVVFFLSGAFEVFTRWDLPGPAQVALVILLIAATLWVSEAVPLFVTSFVVLALGLVWLVPRMRRDGMAISENALLAPFFSDVILLFLGGFVLSAALHKYRLDEQMARWMLARTGRRVPVMLIGIPGVIVMIVVAWTVLMLVFRGRQTVIQMTNEGVEIQWSSSVLFVVGVSLVTVLGWTTSGMHGLSVGTVALLPVVAFFGTKILAVRDLKTLSWDVLLMMGGGLCLGKVIAVSGLAVWMVERLPVENTDCFTLLVILGSAACLMSSVMSNTATANLLMPIILGLSVENLSPVLVGVAFACTLAMPLPVSTPPNAITFSSGELTVNDMLLPGAIVTVTGLALALTTGHWWWDLVGLF